MKYSTWSMMNESQETWPSWSTETKTHPTLWLFVKCKALFRRKFKVWRFPTMSTNEIGPGLNKRIHLDCKVKDFSRHTYSISLNKPVKEKFGDVLNLITRARIWRRKVGEVAKVPSKTTAHSGLYAAFLMCNSRQSNMEPQLTNNLSMLLANTSSEATQYFLMVHCPSI